MRKTIKQINLAKIKSQFAGNEEFTELNSNKSKQMQQKDFYLNQICSLFVHDSQKHRPVSTFISFHTTKSLIQHLITISSPYYEESYS